MIVGSKSVGKKDEGKNCRRLKNSGTLCIKCYSRKKVDVCRMWWIYIWQARLTLPSFLSYHSEKIFISLSKRKISVMYSKHFIFRPVRSVGDVRLSTRYGLGVYKSVFFPFFVLIFFNSLFFF